MKRFFITFSICLVVWLVISWITGLNQAASDGFNEIGFPFVFYREFHGKGNYAELDLGINYKNLIIDLLIVSLVAWGITKVLQRKKQDQ